MSLFIGGSLDGREINVPLGTYSYRVPKPFIPRLTNDEADFDSGLDVETYLFDHTLGKFVEESMASSGSIRWQTYEMHRVIGQLLLDTNPDILEVGVRYFHKNFDAYIAGETIRMMQKVGIKLNVVKYLLDKNKELEAHNLQLIDDNNRLHKQNKNLKVDLGEELLKSIYATND